MHLGQKSEPEKECLSGASYSEAYDVCLSRYYDARI